MSHLVFSHIWEGGISVTKWLLVYLLQISFSMGFVSFCAYY